MFGALAYGQTPYCGVDSFVEGTSVSIVVEPSVSSAAAHGIGGSAAIIVPNFVVTIGADQVPRECTVVVEAGILVSLSSTIPTYAVGLISPTVSVSAAGSTTASGVGAVQIVPSVSCSVINMLPFSVSITAPVRTSITASASPIGLVAVRPTVSALVDGLVVTHGRAAITIPSYVFASVKTGFVGSVSATIQSVFSATANHAKSSNAAVNVQVTVASVLTAGCSITGSATIPVYFSAVSGAYQNIQIGAAIEVPIYPYIRCTFGDDLLDANCAYVLTKQLSVSVLQ